MSNKIVNLSGNAIATTWREGEWIYKRQPKHLADNEFYALTHPALARYTPGFVSRIDNETIVMEFVENEPVTNVALFQLSIDISYCLRGARLRHGDLTIPHVLVRNNRPVIIDWAESRTWDDPRPDKRCEGDAYWLKRTMEKLCNPRP